MYQGKNLTDRNIAKVDFRENYIATQGIVIQALERVGSYLYEKGIEPELLQIKKLHS